MSGNIFQINTQFIWHYYFNIILIRIINPLKKFILISIPNRSQICNARPNIQHMHLFFRIHINILTNFRTRTNQTHIPFKHINQLRKFIQFVFTDIIAGPSNPRIMSTHCNKPFLI